MDEQSLSIREVGSNEPRPGSTENLETPNIMTSPVVSVSSLDLAKRDPFFSTSLRGNKHHWTSVTYKVVF